jgi:hypothetical protein
VRFVPTAISIFRLKRVCTRRAIFPGWFDRRPGRSSPAQSGCRGDWSSSFVAGPHLRRSGAPLKRTVRQFDRDRFYLAHSIAGLRNAYPEVAWPPLAGFRNVVVHDYPGIRVERVVSIVKEDLPKLRVQVVDIATEMTTCSPEWFALVNSGGKPGRRALAIKPTHLGYKPGLNYDSLESLLGYGEGDSHR